MKFFQKSHPGNVSSCRSSCRTWCGAAITVPFFMTLAEELQQSTQLRHCNSAIVSMTDEQVLEHLRRRLCLAFFLSCDLAQRAEDNDHLDKPECINGPAMRGYERHVSSETGRCKSGGRWHKEDNLKLISLLLIYLNPFSDVHCRRSVLCTLNPKLAWSDIWNTCRPGWCCKHEPHRENIPKHIQSAP